MATVTLTETEQAVLDVLGAHPDTARMMNSEAITVEALFGPEVILQDDEGPTQGQIAEFDAAARTLHEKGLVKSTKVWGIITWFLSNSHEQGLRDAD